MRRRVRTLGRLLSAGLFVAASYAAASLPSGGLNPSSVAAATSPPTDSVSAARSRLLGTGWDRPQAVRLRWFGVTNLVASFGGRVVLLDGWVMDGPASGHVPISVSDLVATRPAYIYVGHGHFDHMGHVAEIAEATGAKVVGTVEHCRLARSWARRPTAVGCVPILERSTGRPFTAGAAVTPGPLPSAGSLLGPAVGGGTPWGAIGAPAETPAGLAVTVVMSKHSALRPPDLRDPRPGPAAPQPAALLEHSPEPRGAAHFAAHGADPEAGTLAYLFALDDFRLLWHDSSGPLAQPGEEGAAPIREALRSLGKVDVEAGAIIEYHHVTNGLKDLRAYVEAVRPKAFVPLHHDNFFPPFTARGVAYHDDLVAELNRVPPESRPALCFITDPESYRGPLALVASQWAGARRGRLSGCRDGG